MIDELFISVLMSILTLGLMEFILQAWLILTLKADYHLSIIEMAKTLLFGSNQAYFEYLTYSCQPIVCPYHQLNSKMNFCLIFMCLKRLFYECLRDFFYQLLCYLDAKEEWFIIISVNFSNLEPNFYLFYILVEGSLICFLYWMNWLLKAFCIIVKRLKCFSTILHLHANLYAFSWPDMKSGYF